MQDGMPDLELGSVMRSHLPYWLIITGALLVLVGFFGLSISRRRGKKEEADIIGHNVPRPKMAPLPDLLDSRRRTGKRRDNNPTSQN